MYSDFTIQPSFENKYAIVFCLDNNFVKYFGVTLESLIENSSKENKYDIVIFESNITDSNKKRLLKGLPDNFSLRFFNIDEFIKNTFKDISLSISNKRWSISTYYRIFIPFIMQNYEKVLYIDSDTVINRNLDDIYKIDFENKKIMACHDTFVIQSHESKDDMRLDYIENTLKVKKIYDYFNAGVVLFNIPAINPQEYYNDIMELFNTVKIFLFADQEVLNSIFFGNVKFLPFEYNCQIGYKFKGTKYESTLLEEYKSDFLNAQKNPVIIHYTTNLKPWNASPKYNQPELMDIFWQYARKTVFYEEILFSALENYKLKKSAKKAKKNKLLKSDEKKEKNTFLRRLFSVQNSHEQGYKRKIITILGIRLKFKVK